MKICRTCEREFKPSSRHKDCPACRGERAKKPCINCGMLCAKDSTRCTKCNGSRQRGEDNPNWKGGMVYHKKGYKMIASPGHPARIDSSHDYVFEHILVMEGMLGRHLLPYENVHHLNGVKDDNRPDNLELWTRPQPTGIRAKDAVVWAQEILGLYAPELLNGCNSISSDNGIRTRGQYPPIPPEKIMN